MKHIYILPVLLLGFIWIASGSVVLAQGTQYQTPGAYCAAFNSPGTSGYNECVARKSNELQMCPASDYAACERQVLSVPTSGEGPSTTGTQYNSVEAYCAASNSVASPGYNECLTLKRTQLGQCTNQADYFACERQVLSTAPNQPYTPGPNNPPGDPTTPNGVNYGRSDSQCTQGLNTADCRLTWYLQVFTRVAAGLVGLAVAAMIIWGGIQYSASKGDPQRTTEAKNKIKQAILAFMVYIFLFSFLQWLVPGGII